MKHAISSPGAPKAIGPYSPAIRAGQLLFVSGQVAIDPATGNMLEGGIAEETRRVLDNVGALLLAAGRSFGDVARTTVYLADMNDFAAMNAVYGEYFTEPYPARATDHENSRAFLDLMARVLPKTTGDAPAESDEPSRLIVP